MLLKTMQVTGLIDGFGQHFDFFIILTKQLFDYLFLKHWIIGLPMYSNHVDI